MRIVTLAATGLAVVLLLLTAVGAGGDPAPLTLSARIIRGAECPTFDLEPGKFRILDEEARDAFFHLLDEAPGGEVVASLPGGAPGGPASSFSLSDLERVSYVADFDVELGNSTQQRPIRQVLREGAIVDVTATRPPEGETVTFGLRVTLAAVVRPIATFSTRLDNGDVVDIDLPELTVTRTRETVEVPIGGSAVYRASRDTWVLLGAESGPRDGASDDTRPDRRPR